jgi:hypothetical protein
MKRGALNKASGPRASPAVDMNLLLVITGAHLSRLAFAPSCQHVGEGSGLGWLVDLRRGVGGRRHLVPFASLFTWCYSGNNRGRDGSYPHIWRSGSMVFASVTRGLLHALGLMDCIGRRI